MLTKPGAAPKEQPGCFSCTHFLCTIATKLPEREYSPLLLSLSRTRKEPCWLGGERRSCSASFRLILLKYQLGGQSGGVSAVQGDGARTGPHPLSQGRGAAPSHHLLTPGSHQASGTEASPRLRACKHGCRAHCCQPALGLLRRIGFAGTCCILLQLADCKPFPPAVSGHRCIDLARSQLRPKIRRFTPVAQCSREASTWADSLR